MTAAVQNIVTNGGLILPSGNSTTDKPIVSSDLNGLIRYNSTSHEIEVIINGAYTTLFTGSSVIAAGAGGVDGQIQINSGGVLDGVNVTGTGNVVRATSPTITSPTLVTAALGTPTSGTLTNCTGLPVAGGGTGLATTTAYSILANNTVTPGALLSTQNIIVGAPGYSDVNFVYQSTKASVSYIQSGLQNTTAGAASSADYILANDRTTSSTYYLDLGINSSVFSGTGSFNIAGGSYLYSQGQDLAIGTTTANSLHFVTNNNTTDALTILSSGYVGIGNASPSTALQVNGTITATAVNATTFTGALASAVTATTQAVGTNNTTVATTAFINNMGLGYTGFRNRIINGSFNIWNRGSTRYSTYSASSRYRADMWGSGQYQSGAFEQITRSGAGPTSQYAMRVSSSSTAEASTGTRLALGQLIETANCIDLAGQSIIMSFWIKFSAASVASYGDFSYELWEYDTVVTNFISTSPTRTNATTITNGSLPTTWTKYTKTITAGVGIDNLSPHFGFANLANTTNNSDFYYDITEVQVEHGSIVTPFEVRSYDVERELCCIPDDNSGLGFSHNTYIQANGAFSYRNKIINGNMEIAQRAITATLNGSTSPFIVDRFGSYVYGTSSAVATVTQSTDVPSGYEFQYSARVTVTTADTSIAAGETGFVFYRIEGCNAYDLIGRTFTLSFWVRSTKTGTHCVSFRNSNSDRSYVTEYTINTTNTWEYKTITILGGLITSGTWNWTTGVGLGIYWALFAGSNFQTTTGSWQTGDYQITSSQVNCFDTIGNIFAITGVQLEVGTIATPFEHRPYGFELMLCQRYCQIRSRNGGVNRITLGAGANWSTTGGICATQLLIKMRSAPTVTIIGANQFRIIGSNNGSAVTISAIDISEEALVFQYTGTSLTSGGGIVLDNTDSPTIEPFIIFNSEL